MATNQDAHDLLVVHGYAYAYHAPIEYGDGESGPLGFDPEWHEYTSLTESLYAHRLGVIVEREAMSAADRWFWIFGEPA